MKSLGKGVRSKSCDPVEIQSGDQIAIQLEEANYTITGEWKIAQENSGDTVDLNNLLLSFDNLLTIGSTHYLIHPEDVGMLKQLFEKEKANDGVKCRFKIIDSNRHLHIFESNGVLKDEHRVSVDPLKATMDSTLDMIQVFDAVRNEQDEIIDFRWVLNNHAAQKLFGDVIGKRLLENNPGVSREGIFDTFKRVVETGVPDQSERHYTHEQFNGWFLQSTVKLNDGVATTTTDITEQKRKEQEIKEQRHFISQVAETVPDMISVMEIKTRRISYLNERTFSSQGFDPKQMTTVPVQELNLLIHPDDRTIVDNYFHTLEHASDADISETDYRAKSRSGRWNWFHVRGKVFQRDEYGRVTHIVNVIKNITKRKEAELALQETKDTIEKIASTTPDLITIQDAQTNRIIYKNDNDFWKGLLDADVYHIPEADRMSAIIHPEDLQKTKAFLMERQLLRDGEWKEIQVRLINENWIGIRSKVFMRDAQGNAAEIISFTSNITTAKKSESQLQRTNRLLESVLENTSGHIMLLEPRKDNTGRVIDFKYVFANSSTLRSVKRGSLIGKYFLEEFPKAREQGLLQRYIHVFETGMAWHGETYISFSGRDVWSEVYVKKVNGGVLVTYYDITARKKAEQEILALKDQLADEALQKSEEKYRILFETMEEGVAHCEVIRNEEGVVIDAHYLDANPAIERHTGLRSNALAGCLISAVVPDMGSRLIQTIGRVVDSRQPETDDYYNAVLDRWHELRIFPLDGDQFGIIYHDVTSRKKAQEASRESEERKEVLLEQRTAELIKNYEILRQSEEVAAMGSWDYDLRTENFTWSEGMYRLFNRSTSDKITPEIYLQTIIPEDIAKGKRIVNYFRHEPQDFEETIRIRCNEKIKTIKVKGSVLKNENGAPIRIIGVDVDISTLIEFQEENLRMHQMLAQRATDKYQELFNSIDQGFCIIKMQFDEDDKAIDYTFVEVNPAFAHHTGLINATGKSMRELQPKHEEHWFEIYGTVARLQKPARFIQQAKALGDRWYEVFAFPTDEPEKKHVAILFYDITERKRSEEQLKELNSRLQEMDKAKTNFFNNVSHEFRTPLTLLIGPLEEVIKNSHSKVLPEEIQKLQLSYRSALRLQKLVNTLLDFARIEGGKLEAFYQPTDFAKTTMELAANFRTAIEKAGIKFVVKGDKIDAPVYLNREMWEKIVFNLLSNAFKFTHKGKIEVSIREKKKTVELHVKDTGIGMSTKNIDRIFQRFSRIEGVKARTYEGTGIGLALVKELVIAHGGTISVKSKEGFGSEFTVVIPKGKSHLPAKQIFESKEQLPSTLSSDSFIEEAMGWMPESAQKAKRNVAKYNREKGIRILVAEDNSDMREYLTTVLSDEYNILAVEHGQKVIDFLNEGGKADLILADVMMPHVDGYKMVEQLKANPEFADIPVVLLSARSNEESKLEGLKIGADDYLVKPFSAKELRALISSRVSISHRRQSSKEILATRNLELERVVHERTAELQHLNDSLRKKNAALTSMNEELTNFAFIASHDLREPLRKIQLYASEISLKDAANLSERGRVFTGKIIGAVERMNDLIEDILTYSKIASHPRRDYVMTDLNHVLTEILEDLNETIQLSRARIISNNLPSLTCNALQIRQLLQNLVSNAIKFQYANKIPEIKIMGHVIPGETIASPLANMELNYVKIEVTDNGIGIEEKYFDKIFAIFQRLHGRSTYPGTGIGLAICKKVVENHRGFIVAKSTIGEGSTFTCFLPVNN